MHKAIPGVWPLTTKVFSMGFQQQNNLFSTGMRIYYFFNISNWKSIAAKQILCWYGSINGSNPIDHHTIHPDRHLHSPQIKNQLFKIHFILFLSLSKLRGFEFPRRRKLKCFPLDLQIVFSCFNFILLLGSKRYEITTFFFTLHWNHNRRRNIYLLAFRELTLNRVEE